MVSPWKSQKVIVEMINPPGKDLLAINTETKDVIDHQIEIKETNLKLIMFGKTGEA